MGVGGSLSWESRHAWDYVLDLAYDGVDEVEYDGGEDADDD